LLLIRGASPDAPEVGVGAIPTGAWSTATAEGALPDAVPSAEHFPETIRPPLLRNGYDEARVRA
jgi:hypothetical protein